jgi:hypothetical protein
MKFKRRIISTKRGIPMVNIPKIVSQNWDGTTECDIEFVENTSTLIIRPVGQPLNKRQIANEVP